MNKLSTLLFSTLILSAACDSEPAPQLVCADGEVACSTGVCIAADDLCPADTLAGEPADPLASKRDKYGVGGGVCGGEALDNDGQVSERWSIAREPGRLIVTIDEEADGDVDETFTQDYTSPTRLTSASRVRPEEQLSLDYTWGFDLFGQVDRVDVDDGEAPYRIEWRYYFDRIERISAEERKVARFDAEQRIGRVETYDAGESQARETAEYIYRGDLTTEIRWTGGLDLTMPVVRDELGRVLRYGIDGFGVRYERDELGRVTAKHTAFAELSNTRHYFYDCE